MAVTSSITPNMDLVVDIPNVTPGPQWGADVAGNFTTIDSHNHTSGSGIQIPVAGININTDLPLQNNNLTFARSVILNNNPVPLTLSSDVGSLSNVSGNMTWNNGTGVSIQITAGNSLNSGLIGGITGLGGSSAAVTYSDSIKTFTFTQNPTASAGIDVGNITAHGKLFITGSGGIYVDEKIDTTSGATGSVAFYTTAGNFLISSSAGGATIISSSGLISNSPVTLSSTLNVVGLARFTGALSAGTASAVQLIAQTSSLYFASASFLSASTLSAGVFQGAATLSSTLNVIGATALSGATRLGSDLQVAGNATVTGSTTLQVLNVASNTTLTGALNSTGAVTLSGNLNINTTPVKLNTSNTSTGTTMLSMSGDIIAQGGFRQQIGPASYYSVGGGQGSFTPLNANYSIFGSQNTEQAIWAWTAPSPGSVIGISVFYAQAPSTTFTLQVYLNGVGISGCTLSTSPTGANQGFSVTFPKDTYAFSANNYLSIYMNGGGSGALQMMAYIMVEC